MTDSWSILEAHFRPAANRAYEGLFTQGSGYLHVRGSLEEHLFNDPQNQEYIRRPANVTAEKFFETKARWGAFIPGVRGIHPLLNRSLVNLPFFLALAPFVGGEKLDMEASNATMICMPGSTCSRKIAMEADIPTFHPRLPAHWSRLVFPLAWRGGLFRIEIQPDRMQISNLGSAPQQISAYGYTRTIDPGATTIFQIHASTKGGD